MMDCKQAIRGMDEALDAGRTGALPEAVRTHLAGCAACRRAWREAMALESGLGEAAREGEATPFPPALHLRIMTAVREEQRRTKNARPERGGVPARRMLAAAAVLLIVVSAGLVNRRSQTIPMQPENSTQYADANANDVSADGFPVNIDLTEWLGNPKQDLKELASAILSTTSGVIDVEGLTQSAKSASPQATPNL